MPDNNNGNVFELLPNSVSVNQGAYGTPVRWKRHRAVILTPLDAYLTPTNFTTTKATIQAKLIHSDPYTRWQMISTILEAKDESSSAKNLEFGYGPSQQIYDGAYGVMYYFGDSDLAKHMRRQAFNQRAEEFLCIIVDEANNLIGTKGDDGSGNVVFKGFTMTDMLAMNNTMDMGEGSKQAMKISFADSLEFNKGNLLVINAGFKPWTDLKVVADVKVNQITALSTRTVGISLIVEGGEIGTNLAEKYAATFAANTTAVTGLNKTSNLAVAVTSISATADSNGTHYLSVTFSATNFPTSGQVLEIGLDSIANLATLSMKYFEVPTPNKLRITIP